MKKKIIKVTAAQLEKLAGLLIDVPDSPPGSCLSKEQLMFQARGDAPLDEAHLSSCEACARSLEQLMEELELEKKVIAFPFAGANAAWQDYCDTRLPLAAAPGLRWDWKEQDAEVHAVENSNGDLVFQLYSSNSGLIGKPIHLRAGTNVFTDVWKQGPESQLKAKISISKKARPAKLSEMLFE